MQTIVSSSWYPFDVITIYDYYTNSIPLNDALSEVVLRSIAAGPDPRISSCFDCNSSVVATEPFSTLLDEIANNYSSVSDSIQELIDFVEESESVHLYIWEDNDCIHRIWRDPIASEWSEATGEKRLRS